jgi:hypothetical protein
VYPYLNKHTIIIVTIIMFPIKTAAVMKELKIFVDSGASSEVSIIC